MSGFFKEGDLYKVINIFGKTFELRYGYYSESDRMCEYNEVIPIYPDFIKVPVYTSEGYPFVTQMQDVCKHFEGESESDDCFGCIHYHHGEDLLGICKCNKNKQKSNFT